MPFSLARRFDRFHLDCAEIVRCLSHPARIFIVKYLIDHGECHVDVIRRQTPLSRAGMSYHLEMLREIGLLEFRERRPYIFYSVNPVALGVLKSALGDLVEMFSE